MNRPKKKMFDRVMIKEDKVDQKKRKKVFDKDFIKTLPEDPTQAAEKICNQFLLFDDFFTSTEDKIANFHLYLDALGFAEVFIEAHGLSIGKIGIDPAFGASRFNINKITEFFDQWRTFSIAEITTRTIGRAKQDYEAKLGKVLCYEFSETDLDRVQKLINELRDLISKSKDFEEDHKKRILKRLEKLQSELHKKMSSLDILWGLVGDAGVALGKFGKNAKPFTDRIGEILQIVCRTQAKAENMKGTLPLRLLTGDQTEPNEKES